MVAAMTANLLSMPGADEGLLKPEVLEVLVPDEHCVPVVFTSPHSGRNYPDAFIKASRLDPVALRHSEDAFVDELFRDATVCGTPFLHALFPRAFVDVNREAFELDPAMFEGTLPEGVNTTSPRVAAGFGTIARIVASGQEIYRHRLQFDEVRSRIDTCYRPYHRALGKLVAGTVERFGGCLLVDCHSMPSSMANGRDKVFGMVRMRDEERVDLVIGDFWGRACGVRLSGMIEAAANAVGFSTRCNVPYAGGFTTRHYGRPATGVHAIQLEVCRSLYMNEERVERGVAFDDIASRLSEMVATICASSSGLMGLPE